MEEFGEKLRKAREAKGMTQQSLAEKLYVTRQAVSRWECGDRFPDLITTKRISQILNVSVDELISDNEMKSVAERNPIIEKPYINNIAITLFAFIIFTYIVSVVNILIQNPFQSLSTLYYDVWMIGVYLLCGMIQIVIFAYGLVMAVKEMLSPKKTGFIVSVFFITICMIDFCQIIRSVEPARIFSISLIAVPSILGAIASYMYFCKAKTARIWTVLISAASLWGITRAVMATYIQVKYAYQFVTMDTALRTSLSICIYLLVIYQVYTLKRKRCLALEMSQKGTAVLIES